MPYIDVIYYNNTYEGVPIADTGQLERLISKASREIDTVIGYKIQDLSTEPEFIQEQVKKATSAQVEHLYAKELASSGGGADYSIGKFKVTSKGSEVTPTNTGRYSEETIDYLVPTGLLYSGVETR